MTIPFFSSSTPASGGAAPSGGLVRIPNPFAAPAPATTAAAAAAAQGTPALESKQSAQALAIWVAAALEDRRDALRLARLKREDKLDEIADFDDDTVKPIRDAVRAAQDDDAIKPDITPDHTAAAASVGANARLVAAAAEAIEANGGGDEARLWAITLLDAAQADRAARAIGRILALDLLNEGQDVGALNKRIQDLEEVVKVLKKKGVI